MKKYFTKILAITTLLLFGVFSVNGQTLVWDKSEIITDWADGSTASIIKEANGVKIEQIGTKGIANGYIDLANSNANLVLNSTTNDAITITSTNPITEIKLTYSANNSTRTTNPYVGFHSSPTAMGSANATVSSCLMDTIGVTGTTAEQRSYPTPTGTTFAVIVRNKGCDATAANGNTARITRIEVYTAATSPIISSFTAAGIPATIDQAAGTISAELIYGTDLTNITPNIVLGGTATSYLPTGAQNFSGGPVNYKAIHGTDTTTYAVTLTTQATAGKELTELIFSNSFNAFIVGETVTAYYMAGQAKPTIQSYQASAGATVAISADGTKVVVTGADNVDRELALTLEPVTPITGSTSVTFDGTETWIKTGNAFDATKGWVFSKDVEDPDNKRISEGKSRIYFFVGSYSKLTFTSGTVARNIKVFANGTELLSPTSTAPSGETFDIDLSGASNYMIGIYSNKTNGDGGVTAMSSVITSVKQTQELGISFDGKTIRNPNGVALHVFDIAGRLVHASHTDIEMNNNQKGIYIVKSGADAMKICVK